MSDEREPQPHTEEEGPASSGGEEEEDEEEEEEYTPAPPPPLRFDLDGEDTPSRTDLRKWHRASVEEHNFLQRRVQKLRAAEAAALRKLEETHSRASKMYEQRQRNDQKRKEHQEWRESRLRAQHKEKTIVAMARSRQHSGLLAAQTKLSLQRKQRALEIKKEREVVDLMAMHRQETRLERARSQKRAIKESQAAWKESRGQELAERRRQERRAELEQLMNQRESNVKSSARLVTEEAVLLHRLFGLKQRNGAALSILSSLVGTQSHPATPRLDEGEDELTESGLPPLPPRKPSTARN